MLRKFKGTIGSTTNENSLEEHGLENLVYPSFFLGQVLIGSRDGQRLFDMSAYKQLQNGQFILQHQYGGTNCNQSLLLGIFLPLSTCRGSELLQKLLRTIKMATPIHMSIGEKDDILSITRQLAEIGPMRLSPGLGEAREALLQFTNPEGMYPWLKDNFQFVSEFDGMSNEDIQRELANLPGSQIDPANYAETHYRWQNLPKDLAMRVQAIVTKALKSHSISRLSSLQWRDFHEFSDWINPEHKSVKLTAALIYQNSD